MNTSEESHLDWNCVQKGHSTTSTSTTTTAMTQSLFNVPMNKNMHSSLKMMTGEDEMEDEYSLDLDAVSRFSSTSPSDPSATVLPLSGIHLQAHATQKHLIEDLELRRRARVIAVPTSDELVRARLMELDEPITLFGETKPLRRQRLRFVLAKKNIIQGLPSSMVSSTSSLDPLKNFGYGKSQNPYLEKNGAETSEPSRPFTTPGPLSLYFFRRALLFDSIRLSSLRIDRQERYENELAPLNDQQWRRRYENIEKQLYEPMQSLMPTLSVVADQRPLSSISFSTDGENLATTSWDGLLKLWQVKTCKEIAVFRGHSERVISIKFRPNVNNSSPSQFIVDMATTSADRTIRLWSKNQNQALTVLRAHQDRVNGLDFDPRYGDFLVAASHDKTWTLWDLQREQLLFQQDGHTRPIHAIRWHPDGALVAAAGVDATARITDLRSGNLIQSFSGHAKAILTLDWHPNGYLLATGSEDHTVRIWDLRMKKLLYIIPAHQSLVSDIKFEPSHGSYLVTAGFDHLAKIWRTEDWRLETVLAGHDAKISALDISPDCANFNPFDFGNINNHNRNCNDDGNSSENSKWGDQKSMDIDENNGQKNKIKIATCGFDRTWKIWTSS